MVKQNSLVKTFFLITLFLSCLSDNIDTKMKQIVYVSGKRIESIAKSELNVSLSYKANFFLHNFPLDTANHMRIARWPNNDVSAFALVAVGASLVPARLNRQKVRRISKKMQAQGLCKTLGTFSGSAVQS